MSESSVSILKYEPSKCPEEGERPKSTHKTGSTGSSGNTADSTPSAKTGERRRKWLEKFGSSAAEEPGKEKWRDASLSDEERWKEWHKAMDKRDHQGSTSGFFTSFYKAKYGGVWFAGLFGN